VLCVAVGLAKVDIPFRLSYRRTGEGNDEIGLAKYLCSHFEGIFNMPFNLTTWGRRLYFPSEGRHAADFYRP
jgi:hypothetical protein